jgi:hypothetical protein
MVADRAKLEPRDEAIVAWACVAPDLDGAGMIIDAANRVMGTPDTVYYETWHHYLGHGLPAGLLMAIVAWLIAIRKFKTALLAFLSLHLHLLMDLAGSRGSNPLDIWPVDYLAPLSDSLSFSWDGQWPLTGWQNSTITVCLMVYCLYRAIGKGRSPVALFSKRADRHVVNSLQSRFAKDKQPA